MSGKCSYCEEPTQKGELCPDHQNTEVKLSLANMVRIDNRRWKQPIKIMRHCLGHAICSYTRREISPAIKLVSRGTKEEIVCPVWFGEYELSFEALHSESLLKAFYSDRYLRYTEVPYEDVLAYNPTIPIPICEYSRFHRPAYICKVSNAKVKAVTVNCARLTSDSHALGTTYGDDQLILLSLLPASLRSEICTHSG